MIKSRHSFTQRDKAIPGELTRICEICGREGLTEYMYAMGASWQVTGHFNVPAFNCNTEPSSQHWGCSPAHAMQALLFCLQHNEHMGVGLIHHKHKDAESEGKPKFAPEHDRLRENIGGGDDWHFKLVERMKVNMTGES